MAAVCRSSPKAVEAVGLHLVDQGVAGAHRFKRQASVVVIGICNRARSGSASATRLSTGHTTSRGRSTAMSSAHGAVRPWSPTFGRRELAGRKVEHRRAESA
jgi:hypothetical protein